MKDREATIQFDMNYCQHYKNDGPNMVCTAGMDLKAVQVVPNPENGMKWGPCIEGHKLENPLAHCPHWLRRTREQGEKRADAMERAMKTFTMVNPFISKWRKQKPIGKQEIVECPACKGKLHLSQSSYNGHVRAKCETKDCVHFIE